MSLLHLQAVAAADAARVAPMVAQCGTLPPDLDDAERFLSLLDESAECFEFRTFDDSEAERKELTRKFSGTLAQRGAELARLNRAGAGVFVVVNAGGQTAKTITRVRAVFADTDGAPLGPIMQCGLEPSFVVESSPGKWHAYWLADDLPLNEFTGVQKAIAVKFGTDASVHDLPRVLRLPGFDHRKGEPFRVRIIHESGALPYSADAIRAAFMPKVDADKAPPAPTTAASPSSTPLVVENRHADALKLAGRMARVVIDGGMTEAIAWAALLAERDAGHWSRHVPNDELRRAFDGALEKLRTGVWESRPDSVESSESNATDNTAPAFVLADMATFATAELPAPRFVVAGLIPHGTVTLLGAHGGAGKSVLALAIAAHVAAGAAWAGFPVKQGRAVFVSLEDPRDLVLHRLRRIVTACALPAAAVAANLAILDGTERDGALVAESAERGVRRLVETPALDELRGLVDGARLIVVDNASDGFAANENDRAQVRGFIRVLSQIARANDAGVVLLAHVDKQSAKFGAMGNSYSGSTAWHNSARSRLALVASDGGAVELRQEKSNLGKCSDPIALQWTADGVLVPGGGSMGEGAALVANADADALLVAIRAAGAVDVNIPTARTGPATAQHVLQTLPELPETLRGAKGKPRFWAALANLQKAGRVSSERYQNEHRHPRTRWVAP